MIRIFWMFIGPVLLFILAISLSSKQDAWLTASSIAYLAILLAVVAARQYDPYDSLGAPVTSAQLRKFAIVVGLIGLALWGIANVVTMNL